MLTAFTVAVAAGAAGGGWTYGYGPLARHSAAASTPRVPVSTAVVRRGTLTVSEQDAGTIGYTSPLTVYAAGAGTVTWLPAAGAVIRRGQRLLAVDGQDTIALYGPTPAWRDFSPGMTDGPDVRELQRNLISLGYDPYHDMSAADGDYGWATQAAVERWQEARGDTASAVITLGQVAFVSGTVRVSAVQSEAGAAVTAGAPLLTVTSTTPVVTVSLPATETGTVRPGQQVTITMPGGSAAPGRILQVGVTSSATSGAGSGTTAGASSSGAGGSGGQQTVSVTASVGAPVTGVEGASVQVAIATQAEPDALIVPISALLAGPGGTYQVTVVSGSSRRNVTVTPGLFDDIGGNVAITGPGITAGTQVEVPQS